MKEIGGYFGLEQLISKEYYSNLIALNTGRSALLYVLKARNIERLYIPSFLCDSISKMCELFGYSYEYYHIDSNFCPQFEKELGLKEYIYIVNYYGQFSNAKIKDMQKKYKNIIVDNTQAFFQKPIDGIDTIYSCRKFFGVPDGSYLSTETYFTEPIENDESARRMRHVLGRFEGMASSYYADYKLNEESYETLGMKYMSALTHNILGAIDYEMVKQKRERNFASLEKSLGTKNKREFVMGEGPFCYPLYCENGLKIKIELAKKRIYIPTLWPNVCEQTWGIERDYAENILPIPCDQRYTTTDMNVVIEEVLKCID